MKSENSETIKWIVSVGAIGLWLSISGVIVMSVFRNVVIIQNAAEMARSIVLWGFWPSIITIAFSILFLRRHWFIGLAYKHKKRKEKNYGR